MNTQQAKEELSREESREVAVFQKPRLPWHPAIGERFGIQISGWKTLTDVIFPGAKSSEIVTLALAYCKQRNLDVFKRPVHIVPMWDSNQGRMIETIWPGISELRTTAFRTGNYAGSDEAEFGPTITRKFKGQIKKGRGNNAEWETKEVEVTFPEWCRVTVYRDLAGRLCKFVGPKVVWLESYATIGRSDLPNAMWQDRPEGQIEKCAEAAALRKAFPEELGNELTAEEMSGRVIHDDSARERTVLIAAPQAVDDEAPPDPKTVKGGQQRPATNNGEQRQTLANNGEQQRTSTNADEIVVEEEDARPVDEDPALETAGGRGNVPIAQSQPDGFTRDEQEWLRELEGAFSTCEDMVSFGMKQREVMAPRKKDFSAQAWAKAQILAEDAFKRIQKAGG